MTPPTNPAREEAEIQERRKFWEDEKWFGKPCPDYDPECVVCIHWEMMSYLRTLEKEHRMMKEAMKLGLSFLEPLERRAGAKTDGGEAMRKALSSLTL